MDHANKFPPYSAEERERFLEIIQGALRVKRHFDLFRWLQSDIQHFLPHDILLATWGNFELGLLYVDVISALPGIRSEPVINRDITPFVQRLFRQWAGNDFAPLTIAAPQGFSLDDRHAGCPINQAFLTMRSALVHGINDERGQHDCMYIVFSKAAQTPRSTQYIELLLPHIDTALRQVTHLPGQRGTAPHARQDEGVEDFGLSEREIEIMEWVRSGKTNSEIGLILNISGFTVKNHLQRIFRKLNVSNRAQAVAQLAKMRKPVGG
ncbi:transcriptional regulator EpsA [Alkalilimnicola ehrlichii]|uniref:Transcriptional regulator EpsA n=1 Tax=Alkalilimnicola ehrlichii TaxID=351052 RepID=A0A3E0WV39_9GAMM|nr:XrtB/PEP-CTERM-associated transcriptional regulator EpsA [Alkalilimnicola ehrlichii]RFA29337.1 transcriptional regulator EpsA [Alkalilimnicola ehrlichii]RFA36852.1 transcriptional regulator EpsA [Alkalilimnicola ehrlichii]